MRREGVLGWSGLDAFDAKDPLAALEAFDAAPSNTHPPQLGSTSCGIAPLQMTFTALEISTLDRLLCTTFSKKRTVPSGAERCQTEREHQQPERARPDRFLARPLH